MNAHPSDDVAPRRSLWLAVVVLVIVFVLIGADVVSDYRTGSSSTHLAVELTVMLAAAFGAIVIWQQLRSTRAAMVSLNRDVHAATAAAERWRRESEEVLAGLATAIDRQFERWALTPAERGVALGLLNGRSHREIARQRSTSERTVRDQARAVYEKAGLDGRAHLAGFFLNGLLAGSAAPGRQEGDGRHPG